MNVIVDVVPMISLGAGDAVISFRFAKREPPELRAADHYRGRSLDCYILAECTEDAEARTLILAFAVTFEQIACDAEALPGDALLN